MSILLSETAAKEIRSIIKDQGLSDNVALRVGVKGGGCSGFSYVLDLTESPPENDEVMECHGQQFAGHVLEKEYNSFFGVPGLLSKSADNFAAEFAKGMKPKDGLERM